MSSYTYSDKELKIRNHWLYFNIFFYLILPALTFIFSIFKPMEYDSYIYGLIFMASSLFFVTLNHWAFVKQGTFLLNLLTCFPFYIFYVLKLAYDVYVGAFDLTELLQVTTLALIGFWGWSINFKLLRLNKRIHLYNGKLHPGALA